MSDQSSPIREPEISRAADLSRVAVANFLRDWAMERFGKHIFHTTAHEAADAILNLAPVAKGAGAEPGAGWVYNSPDTGMEYSTEHPLESGEIPDATDVRRSTFFEDWMFGEIGRLDAKVRELVVNLAPVGGRGATYQARVDEWVLACFGEEVARDVRERNHRFLEESLELVQSNGCTASEAHQLVDYVFGRPVGEPGQEVGGVMNTLAALCNAAGLDLNGEAERELARVWTKVEQIRAKHASKPKHSPLPGLTPSNEESQTNGS